MYKSRIEDKDWKNIYNVPRWWFLLMKRGRKGKARVQIVNRSIDGERRTFFSPHFVPSALCAPLLMQVVSFTWHHSCSHIFVWNRLESLDRIVIGGGKENIIEVIFIQEISRFKLFLVKYETKNRRKYSMDRYRYIYIFFYMETIVEPKWKMQRYSNWAHSMHRIRMRTTKLENSFLLFFSFSYSSIRRKSS